MDAKSDSDELVTVVLEFADEMLVKRGGFVPFGAAMKPDGEILCIAGLDDDPNSDAVEMIELLKSGLRKHADSGDYIATAVAYDVRVVPPGDAMASDAVAVDLDHRNNYSVIVYRPYRMVEGAVVYSELFAEAGAQEMFG